MLDRGAIIPEVVIMLARSCGLVEYDGGTPDYTDVVKVMADIVGPPHAPCRSTRWPVNKLDYPQPGEGGSFNLLGEMADGQ